jgi:hypothetical protein
VTLFQTSKVTCALFKICPRSLKALLVVSLQHSMEFMLLDLSENKARLLSCQLSQKLIESTRTSHPVDISLNQDLGVFFVSLSNGNILAFDSEEG